MYSMLLCSEKKSRAVSHPGQGRKGVHLSALILWHLAGENGSKLLTGQANVTRWAHALCREPPAAYSLE